LNSMKHTITLQLKSQTLMIELVIIAK
jgi:hypothetical protein